MMRVGCIYHRDQQITNFCRDPNCLMPLCPSCIAEHTSYHENDESRPQYTSIFEAQAEVHALLANSLQQLESDRARNRKLLVSIQEVAERIHQKIQIAKNMAYEAVDKAFMGLEKDILTRLEEMHEEKGLYSVEKSHKIDKQLQSNLEQLHTLQEGLRGDRGLSNMIYFLREKQEEVDSFHSQTSTYLNANENYYPTIQINSQAFYSLNAIVSRAIKIMTNDRKVLGESNITKKSRIAHKGDESNAKAVSSKLRDQQVPLIESQMCGYSPNKPAHSPFKSRLKGQTTTAKAKYDGDYENLSRKVAEMRQENERLSRYLQYQ